jgi:hypothetical protein
VELHDCGVQSKPRKQAPKAEAEFLTEQAAAKRASLLKSTLHGWLAKGRTPNGWDLTVKPASESEELLIAEESVRKLERRFVYVSSDKPAKDALSFNPNMADSVRTRFTGDNSKLFPFEKALENFRSEFGKEAGETFKQWCAEERGPGKIRIHPLRDVISNKIYLRESNLCAAEAALKIRYL